MYLSHSHKDFLTIAYDGFIQLQSLFWITEFDYYGLLGMGIIQVHFKNQWIAHVLHSLHDNAYLIKWLSI